MALAPLTGGAPYASTSPTVLRVSAQVGPEIAEVREDRLAVEKRRQEDDQHDIGVELHLGQPGNESEQAPPTTSTIGYGTERWRASALRPATATSSPAIRSSARPIPQVRPTGGGSRPLSGQSFVPGVLGTEPLAR